MKYGWYYEGCPVRGTSEDIWQLLDDAIVDASTNNRLNILRFGKMVTTTVNELINKTDIIHSLWDHSVHDTILNMVNNRYNNNHVHGCNACAYFSNRENAIEAIKRIDMFQVNISDVAIDISKWATAHIEFNPPEHCIDGVYPLPIMYHRRQWFVGEELQNADAVIEFNDSGIWTCKTAAGISTASSLKQAVFDAENIMFNNVMRDA